MLIEEYSVLSFKITRFVQNLLDIHNKNAYNHDRGESLKMFLKIISLNVYPITRRFLSDCKVSTILLKNSQDVLKKKGSCF